MTDELCILYNSVTFDRLYSDTRHSEAEK